MTIELQLPQGINDIALRDWQKFAKLAEDTADAENDFLEIKMLEIFCGLKYKDMHELPLGTFSEATQYLGEVFNTHCPLTNRFTMVGTDGADRPRDGAGAVLSFPTHRSLHPQLRLRGNPHDRQRSGQVSHRRTRLGRGETGGHHRCDPERDRLRAQRHPDPTLRPR